MDTLQPSSARQALLEPVEEESEDERTGWRPKSMMCGVPPGLFLTHSITFFLLSRLIPPSSSGDSVAALSHVHSPSNGSALSTDSLIRGFVPNNQSATVFAATLINAAADVEDNILRLDDDRVKAQDIAGAAMPALIGDAVALITLARAWFAACPYIKLALGQQRIRVGRDTNPSLLNDVYPDIARAILTFLVVLIIFVFEILLLAFTSLSCLESATFVLCFGCFCVGSMLVSCGVLFVSDLSPIFASIGMSLYGCLASFAMWAKVSSIPSGGGDEWTFHLPHSRRPVVEAFTFVECLLRGDFSRYLAAVPFVSAVLLLCEMSCRLQSSFSVLKSIERRLRIVQWALLCALVCSLGALVLDFHVPYYASSPSAAGNFIEGFWFYVSPSRIVFLLLVVIAAVEFAFIRFLALCPWNDVKFRVLERFAASLQSPECQTLPGVPLANRSVSVTPTAPRQSRFGFGVAECSAEAVEARRSVDADVSTSAPSIIYSSSSSPRTSNKRYVAVASTSTSSSTKKDQFSTNASSIDGRDYTTAVGSKHDDFDSRVPKVQPT